MGKDQELLDAARVGNFAVVEKLIFPKSKSSSLAASLGIRVGAYINCQDQAGYTPLHHASLNGHSTIVKILIDAGADVNVPDVKGSCPLHLAAWNGNSEIVRLLLTTGPNFASINEQNGDKETALQCAAQHGHSGAASILLENHCDPEVSANRTAHDITRKSTAFVNAAPQNTRFCIYELMKSQGIRYVF